MLDMFNFLEYVYKLYKPVNGVAGFESHSPRSTRGVIFLLIFKIICKSETNFLYNEANNI